MFRFAELLIVFLIIYIILNLFWYFMVKMSGQSSAPKMMFFGMANKWLDEEAKKSEDANPKRRAK